MREDGVAEEYPLFYFEDDGITVKDEFAELDPPLGHKPELERVAELKIFAAGGDRANATPQVAMINTLFLREHNRIARDLERAHGWDDERIFQTARNILIPMFIKIVIEEYINHISTLAFPVRADTSVAEHADWNRPNWMAVEFNLLYRWHSLIPDTITWPQRGVRAPVAARRMHLDNNFLINAGVGAGLDSSSLQPATAIGILNTADFLIDDSEVEQRTIRQGRANNVASYNDYRAAFKLPRVTRFEQITGDPQRVDALKSVYERPERLEFYTGLFAEDLLENSPLPNLMALMVGVDAFSQALTNPLLSPHVFNRTTFTDAGFRLINETHSLMDIARRNIANGVGAVTLTRTDWRRA
jgi:prostaglandin-endoperoxide synthase 2